LGLAKRGGTIVCNGYKDRFYIRIALMGQLMGLSVFMVIEKPSELEMIIEEAAKLKVTPLIGLRVRLSTISAGKWQNSGGEKSKFGLHASEVLQLIARLQQVDMLNCLQLMHFHMGSQIANIHDIKLALKEAGQFYLQLHKLGANITTVDAGGGLGVDYDGSGSRRECSINYSVNEYAENIVRAFAEVAEQHGLPQPNIITESGRAITAHHAVLITNVTEVESLQGAAAPVEIAGQNIAEAYHNAQFNMAEARAQFVQGDLSLTELAEAEKAMVQHLDGEGGLYCLVVRRIKCKIRQRRQARHLDLQTMTFGSIFPDLLDRVTDRDDVLVDLAANVLANGRQRCSRSDTLGPVGAGDEGGLCCLHHFFGADYGGHCVTVSYAFREDGNIRVHAIAQVDATGVHAEG
jgi:biosynthetic arginine decarboxylase